MTTEESSKLITLGGLETFKEEFDKAVQHRAVSITWSELKTLRDGGKLVAGQSYRITDYETTTSLTDTQSAGHLFDIIVTADDVNSLREEAYAAPHEGETYFDNSNLSAWKLKYTLENDSTRFVWADEENGKGVIYEMQDEFGNKCAYDFKNLMFKRCKATKSGAFYHNLYFGVTNAMGDELPYDATLNKNDYKYLYTFTAYTSNYAQIKDASLNNGDSGVTCYQNVIPACNDPWGDFYGVPGYIPNNIVFQGQGNFYNNSFGAECCYNTIGNSFRYNTIGNNFYYNTIGNSVWGNTIGNNFQYNTIGNSFYNNSIGNYFTDNTIGNSFTENTIGNSFYNNSIGNNCNNNSIGNDCNSNTIGNYCQNNTIGNNSYSNTTGNESYNNTIGNYCQNNTIGNSFSGNSIGNDCNNITIGKDYVRYIVIEDGNKNFTLTSTQTTSSSNHLQNIYISLGVNNSGNAKTISHNTVGDGFKTTYQNSNSTTVNV